MLLSIYQCYLENLLQLHGCKTVTLTGSYSVSSKKSKRIDENLLGIYDFENVLLISLAQYSFKDSLEIKRRLMMVTKIKVTRAY